MRLVQAAAFLLILPLSAGLLTGCAAAPPAAYVDAAGQAEVLRAEAWLNRVQTLQARFIQERDGETASGRLWLDRPDHLRMQYDPPSQQVLTVAGGRVLFADGATGAASSIRLDRTPLALLLTGRIVFSGPVTVVSVRRTPFDAAITVRSTERPQQGVLTLQFSADPFLLRGLVMVDARGATTRLLLQDVRIGGRQAAAIGV